MCPHHDVEHVHVPHPALIIGMKRMLTDGSAIMAAEGRLQAAAADLMSEPCCFDVVCFDVV